jgi:serine palmitoyltransferase
MSSGAELGFLLHPTVEQLLLALASRVDVHFFIEAVFVVVICYLLFQKQYRPNKGRDKLSPHEIDELCHDWQPEPIVSDEMMAGTVARPEKVVTAQNGRTITVGGKEAVNFGSFDFLNMTAEESIKDDCEKTIRKYGVGSCGPRGFYGTIDVHLDLERDLAGFMGTEAGIIYSYDVCTASSVSPCPSCVASMHHTRYLPG